MRRETRLRSLILGIWIGSVLCAGVISAPAIFSKVSSRSDAGTVFGEVLQRLNKLEMVCLLALVAVRIFELKFSVKQPSETIRRLRFSDGGLLLMAGLLFYYSQVLTPEMSRLKAQISTFDVPVAEMKDEQGRKAREQFDSLHKRYSRVMSGNLVLGVVMVFIP